MITKIGLSCAMAVIVNMSDEAWDKRDEWTLNRVKKVCATDKYYQGNRCLKYFAKVTPTHYRVICGPGENE